MSTRYISSLLPPDRASTVLIKRYVENGEDRDTQQRLPVQRPGAGSSLRVAPQLVGSVPAASDDQRRSGGHLLAAQSRPLPGGRSGRGRLLSSRPVTQPR